MEKDEPKVLLTYLVLLGLIWFCFGLVWLGLVSFGMVWYGFAVWFEMVRYGLTLD